MQNPQAPYQRQGQQLGAPTGGQPYPNAPQPLQPMAQGQAMSGQPQQIPPSPTPSAGGAMSPEQQMQMAQMLRV